MTTILVTGATGELGRMSISALLKRDTGAQIVGLARDPAKAIDLSDMGVEIRQGDYGDKASLSAAMHGVDKLLMISTAMFQDTKTQHRNIIDAARTAGVKHIVYTGIQRQEGSGFAIDMVTETDRVTEEALEEAGLDWTILRNSLYLDSLPLIFGSQVESKGILAPAGTARAALGLKADFAEANAAVLTSSGHEGKIYTLGASRAGSLSEMAAVLSEIYGKNITYSEVSRADFVAERVSEGVPDFVADFLGQWAEAIGAGEFSEVTGDLERLIGRKPTDFEEGLKKIYA